MSKKLFVGIDGTGTKSSTESNVWKLLALVNGEDRAVIYQRGLGSHGVGRDKIRGGIFGRGVNRQVRRVYQKINRIYEPGDEIFVVGFSRGGAAAISLCNLIGACGLAKPLADPKIVREAMTVYGAREGYSGVRSARFTEKYDCHLPEIRFLGLFDPVGALGVFLYHRVARVRFGQHDFRIPWNVYRYVALLALDEHRQLFEPVLQTGETDKHVDQIWCPGCHGDVGGGNDQPLSFVALEIMVALANQQGADLLPPEPSGRDRLGPADQTTSWKFPHRLMPRVERPIGSRIATEESMSRLAAEWASRRDTWSVPTHYLHGADRLATFTY